MPVAELFSYAYNLKGKFKIEKACGKFYKLTPTIEKGPMAVYIPVEEIDQVDAWPVDAFSVVGGRRNHRKTKKVRKNSDRYSRHN